MQVSLGKERSNQNYMERLADKLMIILSNIVVDYIYAMPSNLLCQLLCQLFKTFSFHSGIEPVQYEEKLRNSWVWQELKAVRYDHILHSSSSFGTNFPLNIVTFSHLPLDFSFIHYHNEIRVPGWYYMHYCTIS